MRRLAILFPLVVILAACATQATHPQDQVRIAGATYEATANLLTDLRLAGAIDSETWNGVVKPLDDAALGALRKAKARADAGDAFNARYYLTVYQDALDRLRKIIAERGGK